MCIEINKGMYGLPQARRLAQKLLLECFAKYGYSQCNILHWLWRHDTKPIAFTLAVDNFGVNYVNTLDADHLLVPKQHYNVINNWRGEHYIGMHLWQDYKGGRVHVVTPGYVSRALIEFQYKAPKKRQDTPCTMAPRKYWAAYQDVYNQWYHHLLIYQKDQPKVHPKSHRKRYVSWT